LRNQPGFLSKINGSKNFVGKVFMVFKISQGAKHRSRNLWKTLCNFL